MDRRRFLAASIIGSVPITPHAQQAIHDKVKQVGWLAMARLPRLQAEFRNGMRELGYAEGSRYVLVERYADGRLE